MKYIYSFICCLSIFPGIFSQGLLNNGAQIVMTSGSNIHIDGTTGHYTNQSGGLIRSATAGGTIILKGNWINNASNVAFDNDGAAVNLSGANQTIGGSNPTTFYHLSLLGSGTKTLNVNTTVGGISALTGVLTLGTRPLALNSHTLIISNPATAAVTNSTGYILSETNAAINPSIIQWNMGTTTGAHVYPFGVAGTLIPLTFNKTTAGASNISISTRATSADNMPWYGNSSVPAVSTMASAVLDLTDASLASVIDRWWNISNSAPVTANLIFSYRGSENSTTISPSGNFSAQRWNGSGWDPQTGAGTGVTSGVGTVSANAVNVFSPWVLSYNTGGPLPVTLLDFSATCAENGVVIRWSTASEQNSQNFQVERSRDGVSWTLVTTLPAAGNSNTEIQYTVNDPQAASGTSYYRLVQEDINGTQKIYGPVSVSCETQQNGLLIFPNPGKDNFTVEVSAAEKDSNGRLEIFDVSGKLIAQQSINIFPGTNLFPLESFALSSGTYTVRINSSNQNFKPARLMVK